jgi:iron complex outermembrane receptor protein
VGERSTAFDGESPAGAAGAPGRSATDGRVLQAAIDKGVVFGDRGFLHGGFELRDRGATDRAVLGYRSTPTPALDHYGDAHTHDLSVLFNGGNLLANGLELYGNAGGSRRTLGAPTAYTAASPAALPLIDATITDYAGTLGVRGVLEEWRWDLSSVYGRNAVDLALAPAVNPASGASRARLDAGSQRFAQSTTNLELSRAFDTFEELRLTAGAEFRHDGYEVDAGEPAGYADASSAGSWAGLAPFTTSDAASNTRRALAGYVDLETDLTRSVMLAVAGRVEHFSDVGTAQAGKVSLRVEPVRNIVLRGSIARGYRAPSLQQTSLGATYIDPFVGQVALVPAADPRVAALGGSPLRAERSTDYQAGLAVELTSSLSLTVDAYRTDLHDRVVLQDVYGSSGGPSLVQFFQNAVDTRTDGLDATASYLTRFERGASLRLSGGASVNHTSLRSLTQYASIAATSFLSPDGYALSTAEQVRLTRGQPRDNLFLSAQFAMQALGAALRTQRVGEVASGDYAPASSTGQTFAPRWITDASLSYTLLRKYTLTAGADNLFDAYPQRALLPVTSQQPSGTLTPYPGSSPFGFNGRFVYGRLSIYL